jgi:hypothetical protein
MKGILSLVLVLALVALAPALVSAACGPAGDANGDGVVDIGDLSAMIDCVYYNECSGIVCFSNADINHDGVLNQVDIDILVLWLF